MVDKSRDTAVELPIAETEPHLSEAGHRTEVEELAKQALVELSDDTGVLSNYDRVYFQQAIRNITSTYE